MTGTVLSDRYRLEEQIGSGGMGSVWKATDTLLNRPVAVKLLHPAQMAEPTARERFRTEGRITAGLSHPGIAQVFDYGEENGRAFLIMELVVGEPLSQILKENGALSPDTTLDFVCQAAKALAAAHARGVVHRDIKPGNLLVTPEGKLKLTDFGIARGDMSVTLTQTGMVMGTAQYISPEQASGRPATPASDLYALGVVAYECLTGQPPFTGDTPIALALAHTRDEPPELPEDIPDEVDELVSLLLLKDPQERPSSAGEVAHMAAVLRSNAGTGPPTPAAGLEGLAPTMMVRPVPDSGRRTGSLPRRTSGQQVVTEDEEGQQADRSEQRRMGLPVVLAALGAAVLVVVAVLAGYFGSTSEADNVNDSVEPPAAVDSSPSPSAPEPEEEETDGTDVPQVEQDTPQWTPHVPDVPTYEPSSEPTDDAAETSEPEDGEDGAEEEDPGGGTETPDPGGDPGDGSGGGTTPPADSGGTGGGQNDTMTRP
nr:serine/threonine-protein kinase [Nocardiopsis algeriensis]